MKYLILVSFTTLFTTGLTFSQTGWQQIQSVSGNVYWDLSFVSTETGFVLSSNSLLKTTNGGLNWSTVYSDTDFLNSVFFKNESTGFIGTTNKIMKTTNGGINWSQKFFSNFTFSDFAFNSDTNGVAIGFRYESGGVYATVVHTANNGDSWIQVGQYSGSFLSSIAFYTSNIAFISGNSLMGGSFLLRSSNKGVSWTTVTINRNIKKFHFATSNLAFGIGETQFYRSSPAFNYWENTFNSPQTLNDLCFLSPETGYVVGRSGTVFKTLNGGANWYSQSTGTNFILNRIKMVNDNTGYIIGDNQVSGIILKTTNGGGTVGLEIINNQVPAAYSLSQNYPNPFNPSTKIKFDISGTSAAQTFLSVYDILGREVEVLVNEELSPGQYQVDWNASSYPSGVYYYKITAGSFTETKKMVLVK